ncbi:MULTISPECIES: DUF29 domain-containing protein [unclassified Roseitalea]|uniref:DUF29 domain-containing protein n=1 Tax=unclassified Roseitalea TaxID=2639107 RepID=UPI0027401232|nr:MULTISPECIES: DUF29 domain-containing protein [unclassified Roseitalea]
MNKHARLDKPRAYEADYYGWTMDQAAAVRAGRFDLVDRENLAEEIESLGKSEKREIESRLMLVLLHLLKWQFQPDKRKGGWEASIRVQRNDLNEVLSENPSLKDYPVQRLAMAYAKARLAAERETGIAYEAFPEACPYSVAQVLDERFFPDGPTA